MFDKQTLSKLGGSTGYRVAGLEHRPGEDWMGRGKLLTGWSRAVSACADRGVVFQVSVFARGSSFNIRKPRRRGQTME